MRPYCYIKAKTKIGLNVTLVNKPKKKLLFKILSLFSFLMGSFSLGLVVWPMVAYELKQAIVVSNQKIVTPIPEAMILEAKGIIIPIQTTSAVNKSKSDSVEVISSKDFTKASNWFVNPLKKEAVKSQVTHYLLSIPKLKIDKATVTVGGEDLKKSLVQYPGTSWPGQLGNTVILGHSVLPAFYNPKDYNTIFSKIPDLEKGDEITILFDGITYTYTVHDYYERQPEQVDLMEQKFDRYELSLVTCVPQGTYLRRGIVRAYLKQ